MLTVFVYARLWRRSGVMTDVEFYELRYSGRPAAFLRGFRALYLGVFFNVVIMASVTLAAIKIGGVMLKLSPIETVVVAAVVTVIYSALGGLRGVLLTDFLLFIVAMIGSVAAAVVAVGRPEVGGLTGLLAHPNVQGKLSILPDFHDTHALLTVLVIPLAVQWWSVWYPGAEPGGGGYIAQRMLAARDERHATGATLFFNAAHYALRPWPWILVALCSLVVFPDLASLREAFPDVDPRVVKDDLAYPAMLTFLPVGLLGLVVASLIAAYMSTISTHLNWGSSYVVNDFYKRFVRPEASDRELVRVGRLSTFLMMVIAGGVALWLENAVKAFGILLQIGAGTGLLFILRWFWWRINAFSELAAMVVSFAVAVFFELYERVGDRAVDGSAKLVLGVGITTLAWILVTFVTRPTRQETLRRFCALIHPGGPGWRKVLDRAAEEGEPVASAGERWTVPAGIACMVAGCFAVYSALFAVGYWLYGNSVPAAILSVVAIVASVFLVKAWGRIHAQAGPTSPAEPRS
jgi:Na+/proline symporter